MPAHPGSQRRFTIGFTVANQGIRFEPFRLVGTDTNLTARGRVQLSAPQELNYLAHMGNF